MVRNDADSVIDVNVNKCNMYSQLEMQAKSDTELNRVCQAGAEFLPFTEGATEAVWVELEKKNREGLVRRYPVCGIRVGFVIIINSEGAIDG